MGCAKALVAFVLCAVITFGIVVGGTALVGKLMSSPDSNQQLVNLSE